MSRSLFLCGLFAAATLSAAAAAGPLLPAPAQTRPLVLRGGTVHSLTAPASVADVLIVNGRITAIGAQGAAPADAQVIDVKGRHIYPGLIAANTLVGVQEIASVSATTDVAEVGQINPNARSQVAVNPENSQIGVTRHNGVLTALVVPVVSNPAGAGRTLIAGQSALMRLDGWTWEEMTIRGTVGLHVYWPVLTLDRRPRAAKSVDEQQKDIDRQLTALREAFASARAYARTKAAKHDTDLRWEAMLPFVRGQAPVFIHADDQRQIESALDWVEKEKDLRVILVGGLESWRVVERLKKADIPVVLGATHQLPLRRDDAYDAAYSVAAKLHAAGIRFCIAPAGEVENGTDRNLAYQAALAAAHGLPAGEALRAVTLYPAQLLGVGAELGSIEKGKRATLIVTDGDPLEITTQVHLAFIDGAPVDLRSRHTMLHEKYRERIRRVKEQRQAAPLGTQ